MNGYSPYQLRDEYLKLEVLRQPLTIKWLGLGFLLAAIALGALYFSVIAAAIMLGVEAAYAFVLLKTRSRRMKAILRQKEKVLSLFSNNIDALVKLVGSRDFRNSLNQFEILIFFMESKADPDDKDAFLSKLQAIDYIVNPAVRNRVQLYSSGLMTKSPNLN
jgi:hypothetical protein